MTKVNWEVIATRPAGSAFGSWEETEPMAIEDYRLRVDAGYAVMAHRHRDDGIIELLAAKAPHRVQPCNVFHRYEGHSKP